jgi:hypothetical protein
MAESRVIRVEFESSHESWKVQKSSLVESRVIMGRDSSRITRQKRDSSHDSSRVMSDQLWDWKPNFSVSDPNNVKTRNVNVVWDLEKSLGLGLARSQFCSHLGPKKQMSRSPINLGRSWSQSCLSVSDWKTNVLVSDPKVLFTSLMRDLGSVNHGGNLLNRDAHLPTYHLVNL